MALSDEDVRLAELMGRIQALEWLATDEYVESCSRAPSGDVVAAVQANAKVKLASLQNLERPVDDYHDRVWEVAVDTLNRIYANALTRARGFYPEKYS